jgi:hypothetical protein
MIIRNLKDEEEKEENGRRTKGETKRRLTTGVQ